MLTTVWLLLIGATTLASWLKPNDDAAWARVHATFAALLALLAYSEIREVRDHLRADIKACAAAKAAP